jgi:hypothetical protein
MFSMSVVLSIFKKIKECDYSQLQHLQYFFMSFDANQTLFCFRICVSSKGGGVCISVNLHFVYRTLPRNSTAISDFSYVN